MSMWVIFCDECERFLQRGTDVTKCLRGHSLIRPDQMGERFEVAILNKLQGILEALERSQG